LLQTSMAVLSLTSLACAAIFYFAGRANAAQLARYVPFSVMAGFLSATGWLMLSGALNIIAGTPLSIEGVLRFLNDPLRPELAVGVRIASLLLGLAPRVSNAVLLPSVLVGSILVLNVTLRSAVCAPPGCALDTWFFSTASKLAWLPPWRFALERWDIHFLISSLPSMLVLSFVGLLSVLMSVASLELLFHPQYDL